MPGGIVGDVHEEAGHHRGGLRAARRWRRPSRTRWCSRRGARPGPRRSAPAPSGISARPGARASRRWAPGRARSGRPAGRPRGRWRWPPRGPGRGWRRRLRPPARYGCGGVGDSLTVSTTNEHGASPRGGAAGVASPRAPVVGGVLVEGHGDGPGRQAQPLGHVGGGGHDVGHRAVGGQAEVVHQRVALGIDRVAHGEHRLQRGHRGAGDRGVRHRRAGRSVLGVDGERGDGAPGARGVAVARPGPPPVGGVLGQGRRHPPRRPLGRLRNPRRPRQELGQGGVAEELEVVGRGRRSLRSTRC